MAASNLTTLAGLQEQIIADSTAMFRTQSDLFSAVYSQSAGEANTVNFATRAVPAAATAQATENASITPTAVSVGRVSAVLETVPVLAQVSMLAAAAPGVDVQVAEQLAGGIARYIDTDIAANYDNFSVVGGTNATSLDLDDFFGASATLDATGFIGQKVAVFHPVQWSQIGAALLALDSNAKSDEYLGRGYVSTVGGVQIYVSPWVSTETDTNLIANGAMYFKEAIGLGYREPIMDVDMAPNLGIAGIDILGTAFVKSVELVDNMGVKLISQIA